MTSTVVRDPSGFLPCYYWEHDDGIIFTSDTRLLASAGLLRPRINWVAIARHLYAEHSRSPQTCLEGVAELVGGTGLVISNEWRREETSWSPWDFADRDSQETDFNRGARTIRAAVDQSVSAWSSLYGNMILGLSGGLDSSIVAAALKRAGASFSCLTDVTTDPSGDERDFARLMAEAVNAPLVESRQLVSAIDIRKSAAAHLPRPSARSFAQASDGALAALADSTGAEAFFGGGGGDNVFCYLRSVAPVADRFLTSGLRDGLRTAHDISDLTGAGILHVIGKGLSRAWLRESRYRWPTNPRFLAQDAIASVDASLFHPWLRPPAGALPGKAAHIAAILAFHNHMEGYGRELLRPVRSPLMAQPVIEAALRIPTWMWCAGGRDRAVARAAFGDLPHAILDRRSKGTPDSFAAEIYEQNASRIRDMLVDGHLHRNGLLDISQILAAIVPGRPVVGYDYLRLLALADMEAWIRSWLG
ncbi:asparagine synthase-related protein [Sphingomonas oryzagri]